MIATTVWKSVRSGDAVTFTAPAVDHPWPLLVWPGRGLGISDTQVDAFYGEIAEAMKHPTYPHRLASRRWFPWSAARLDHDDGFAYLSGPAHVERPAIGYRPAAAVRITVADLRHLRIRLAAYLGELGRL